MRRTMIVLVLVLAACGGTADTTTATEPDTATDTTSADEMPETTTAASTETTAMAEETTTTAEPEAADETTTVVAAGGEIDSCLVGTWELDPDAFVAEMSKVADQMNPTGGEVEVSPSGGVYQMTAADDGTWTAERIDFGWVIDLGEAGELVVLSNGTDSGTWSADGTMLTTTVESSDVTIDVSGVMGGVDVNLDSSMLPSDFTSDAMTTGTVGYTCTGDELTVDGGDEFSTAWTRV